MGKIIGCIGGALLFLAVEALIAWLITLAFNSWTQIHTDFWTTYIVLLVLSALFGGGSQVRRR